MRTPPASRLMRGWLAAAVSTLFASASHWAASDAALFSFGSLIAFLLAGIVCVGLAGRELSTGRLALGVGLSQVAFHSLFSAFGATPIFGAASPSGSPAQLSASMQHSGHLHGAASGAVPSGAVSQAVPLPGSAPLPGAHDAAIHMGGSLAESGLLMTASHIAAAALTVVVLRRGELALRLLAELALTLAARLALPAPAAALPVPGPLPVLGSPTPLTDLQLILSGPARRGPPVLALAA